MQQEAAGPAQPAQVGKYEPRAALRSRRAGSGRCRCLPQRGVPPSSATGAGRPRRRLRQAAAAGWSSLI